ncbi:PHP domain-containing protein [Aquipuribacter hungaricus]|uniref:PHP domain-containing protein n=1 Tax=Aquipuribacter hungaricus TaxID=545624 RepID=A0ABV7WAC1_9MICO
MPYDLHTHSTASDGTTSPAEVVRAAAAAGLTGLALTDHDTGAGLAEAAAAAGEAGIDLVPGVEISTQVLGRSVHLLGYGDITATAPLAGVLAGTVDSRHSRLRRIVERLARVVPGLTVADVVARVPLGVTPGRPHIADALVALGAVPDRDAAFVELLSEDGPYYVGYSAPGLLESVRLVTAAGGAAVVAHPGSRSAADLLDEDLLAELADAGLAGLEVDHRDHDGPTRERLRATAARLGLLATGSSDFHGAGKQNRLAESTTPDDVVAELLARAASGTGARP